MVEATLKSLHPYPRLLENPSELRRRTPTSSNPRSPREGLSEMSKLVGLDNAAFNDPQNTASVIGPQRFVMISGGTFPHQPCRPRLREHEGAPDSADRPDAFRRRGRNKKTGQPGNRRPSHRICPAVYPRQQSRADSCGMSHPFMNIINIPKLICLTIIQLAKQAWLLPQSIANAVEQRRRQTVLIELEAERLDRIRNPSKYLGKS